MAKIDTIYKSDEQLAEVLGIKDDDFKSIFTVWEKAGFPQKDSMVNKRYWPAIKAWLDRRHGIAASSATPKPDGEERWTS